MEIWKDIEGFEGFYQVSTFGRVRGVDRYIGYRNGKKRFWKGEIKKPTVTAKGYLKISMFNGDKKKTDEIQRLVARAFIPNPLNKAYVNHKDGNKKNNRVENLEWTTPSENTIHAREVLKVAIKGVDQYDLSGNFIAHYESQKKAAEATHTCKCGISNNVCGRRKKAGGYVWKLSE